MPRNNFSGFLSLSAGLSTCKQRMNKYLLIVFFTFSFPGVILAQQDLQVSQFFHNKVFYNPAVSGMGQALSVNALYRTQWVGLDGQPVSQLLSADLPLYNINSGAGIYFTNDQVGAFQDMTLKALYSYQLKVGNGILSTGINAGVIQKKIDGTRLRAPQGNYDPDPGTIDHNDQFIPSTQVGAMAPDIGLGAYYLKDNLSVGVAVNHLLNPMLTLEMSNGAATDFRYKNHLVAHSQYLVKINDNIDLQPAILIKTDFVKHQLDVNATAIYNDNFWAGLSFRGYNKHSSDALIGMVGLKLSDTWNFGYSYDYNISGLQSVNSGSHELFVNYRISIEKPRKGKIINNPRFLSF